MNLEKFININWYIERKPYKNHSSYDIFYLRICRELFKLIDRIARAQGAKVDFDKEDCRELAYIFTAYFEDRVNNIGFWDALIALHQKHFGKRLPFFDKETLKQQEGEYDDILPEDIHYLAYISSINLLSYGDEKPIISFNSDFLIRLKDSVFDYLEAIDEVVITDFYESFLVPEDDYIDFKRQLHWFTFSSYLTSTEFGRKMAEQTAQLMDEDIDPSDIQPLIYSVTDRLMCEAPSSFTAFFPADMLAEAMRCNDTRKDEIRNLKWRADGIFHVQRETPTHYRFLHTSTGEEFDVLKNCFNVPINVDHQEYWITTVVGWNNDYYISGLCSQSQYKGEEIYHANLKNQQQFQRHFAPYRKEIMETALKSREAAAKYFGDDLVVFDTGYQLQEKLNEYNEWYYNLVAADKSNPPPDTQPIKFNLPAELLNAKGVALFIPPQDGLQFILKHQQLINVLQKTTTNKFTGEEVHDMLEMLGDDTIGSDYWFYIKKHFPLRNLSGFMKIPLDDDKDFEALLRIYLPEDFSPLKLPRFTTFTSERITTEKAREIFRVEE